MEYPQGAQSLAVILKKKLWRYILFQKILIYIITFNQVWNSLWHVCLAYLSARTGHGGQQYWHVTELLPVTSNQSSDFHPTQFHLCKRRFEVR